MASIFNSFVQSGVVIPNNPQWRVESHTVVAAGAPENLQSIPIPDSVSVVIRAKLSNPKGSKVYVANSSANALDATKRIELSPGESLSLYITNTNLVWIDATANGLGVDIVAEA